MDTATVELGQLLIANSRADAGRCYVHDVGRSVDVPVLVVGGGPVGLLMATGLRHFGVDCLVVEKHASTLDFPKGRRVTTGARGCRSMASTGRAQPAS